MSDNLKKRSTVAFVWDFAGTFVRQGSGFVISIILARLLEPAQFGLIGMAMVFISISQVFVDVGFSSALIQNKDNTNLTYNSIFYLNVVAGLFLTLLFYFLAPFIGAFYENSQITDIVRWLSLMFVFNSFGLVQQAILRRKLNFRILTLRMIAAGIIGGVAGVIAAFLGLGVYSLVIQHLTIALVGTALLWATSGWRPELQFSREEVNKLLGFSSFVFFDRFISKIFKRLDILFIGKLFSPASLGFYTRALSLKDQVTKYSSSTLTKVFFPILSSIRDNKDEYCRIYFKVLSVVSFLSFGLTGILYILGPDIIVFLYGKKWMPSIQIFQILILAAGNYPISAMIVSSFLSKGKSKQNFYIGLFRKSFLIIPFYFGYIYGLYEFTIALVILNYFLTITNILFAGSFVGLSIRKHFVKILEGLFPLVMLIVVYSLLDPSLPWIRILLTLGYVVFYLLFNYLVKSEGLPFVWNNVVKIKDKIITAIR